MCSLALFPPPPPRGHVTLCERNNELIAADVEDPQFTEQIPRLSFPTVYFPRDSVRTSSGPESTLHAAFLNQPCNSFWRKTARAWREAGLVGLLEEILHPEDKVPSWLMSASKGALNLYRWLISMRTLFHPHYLIGHEEMVSKFSQVTDWHNSPLRVFAWHPHTAKLAVALLDDSIRIFYVKSRTVPVLRHRCQRGVADIAWRPMAAAGLAVACRGAVVIWQVEPSSLSTRPSSCCVQVLSQSGPVTSLAWNPHGEMLIAASPASSSLKVWEVATERCITLPVHGAGGIANLSWSPDGARLLVATLSPVIRVYETLTWNWERWPTLSGRCQSACWSPDGSILLFAVQGEHVIYSLKFTTGAGIVGGSKAAAICADVSTFEIESADGRSVKVGGEVQMMTWDSTGERLAVLLRGENKIAIFKTRTHPLFELLPCGFVQGEEGTVPQLMSFFPTFGKGALLTVGWSNGRLSHIPFSFVVGHKVPRSPLKATELNRSQSLFSQMI
uniref:aladin isoform X2 n=1 Tax=Myxine glutinosa TaxID=7769 RepID=UPI00358E9396